MSIQASRCPATPGLRLRRRGGGVLAGGINFGAIPASRLTVDLGGAMGLSAYLLPLGAVAAAMCLVLALALLAKAASRGRR